jgi:Stage II sporulation protein E (SpoIIE)
MFPDDLAEAVALLVADHTSARDVALLLVDLDQEVLTPIRGGEPHWVEWSAAGQAFREEQPVVERTPDGRRLWLPILDSAERVGVLGLLGGEEHPVDDWLSVASLLGELVVSKERYGDLIARVRRRQPVSLAAEMRWSMLPPLTFSSQLVAVSGILQPSHGIAGDAFDYAVDDTTATVAIFDAMGHGLRASRLANVAIGGFRAARRAGLDSATILADMDDVLDQEFDGAAFVTAQVVALDLKSGVATIRTAGHPPPVRLRAGEAPHLVDVVPGLPLGIGPSSYEPTRVQLEEGDALLLVSDGVYEARSPSGEQYGWERMLRVAQGRLDAGDRPAELLRRTLRDVTTFQGGFQEGREDSHRSDDATMVLVRWCPASVGQPSGPRGDQLEETEEPSP